MAVIAVIDDDVYIGDMLEELLKKEGHRVLRAYSGTEALMLLGTDTPDLVLLDLMLPGLSGEEVLPRIQGLPVIVLSAKTEIDSKVRMLLGGAVDYVTKPFDSRELLARIEVHLRSGTGSVRDNILSYRGLTIDKDTRRVLADGVEIRLTKTEYAILKLLMSNSSRVMTKAQILDGIFEDTPDCVESSLKVHMSNLRRKLREASGKEYIDAVWGIGFKMAGDP